ncbi:carbohydrate ABC transporter permease [Devosia rhodophyticola]|uniref:Carbohydrate ABC transporter permease n=1 Tax=Devosia rhodophyticola TaxID=3026423 RepID=A0ABY7Z012_9HYPH|nr:carbohydrate ABC transporter permease [Devosia rhodophyticola]WDR06862.1 carbohydrate ABC transporter permease [Devosia rhodophyticola]
MAVDITDQNFINALIEKERRAQKSGGRWLVVPIIALTVAYLTPFYYLFVTIFKTTEEYATSGVLDLPNSLAPIVDNVVQAWTLANLGEAAINSLTYAGIGAALAVAFAAAAAYGMTRLKLIGANGWFMLIFTGTLFPFQMYLVPLLFGYQRLGLVNSWLGMLLIYVAICIPFPLLVLRNSFSGITHEVDEAARIEGASEWRVFISMIIPNATGPLIALFLLQFTFIWNDLLFSSILANGIEVRSIMVALQSLQGTYSTTGPNVVITATLISSIPTVLMFIVLRRYFMAGLQLGSK